VLNNNTVVGTVSRRSVAEKLGTKRNSTISPNSIHVASTVEEDFTTVYPDQDIEILVRYSRPTNWLLFYDDEHRLVGKVTAQDLLRVYRPAGPLAEVIEKAYTIDTEERVCTPRRRMIDDNHPPVYCDRHDQAIGIVTETDVCSSDEEFPRDS